MKKLHIATEDDLRAVLDGFKLYKKEGKFQYVRNDYVKREIAAGHIFLDNGTIAVIAQVKRGGKIGSYRYSAGEWNIHQILSINKDDKTGPFIFMRRFIDEYATPGIIYGTVHNSNMQSMKWHEAVGFKRVGDVLWSNGTIPGTVYAYDNSIDVEKFAK